jgi:hypothetical protein
MEEIKKEVETIDKSDKKLPLSAVSGRSEKLVCRLHSMRKNCREYRYNKKYCKKCPHNVRQTNCH